MGLRQLGIPAMAITSLTPKDDVTAAYQQMEAGTGALLVYGALPLPIFRPCCPFTLAVQQLRGALCSPGITASVGAAS